MRRAESSDYAVIFILAAFAVLAMVVATTGLFGVVSYSVAQRTPEFGTRIALGAPAATVVGLVARQSLSLFAIGLTLGLAGGVTVAFGMQNLLFGVTPTDPATLASVTGLLLVVAVLATALPAWRASRVDPVIALRAE
jgi:ABC-type antimicrobial peptide transport system permease subunit